MSRPPRSRHASDCTLLTVCTHFLLSLHVVCSRARRVLDEVAITTPEDWRALDADDLSEVRARKPSAAAPHHGLAGVNLTCSAAPTGSLVSTPCLYCCSAAPTTYLPHPLVVRDTQAMGELKKAGVALGDRSKMKRAVIGATCGRLEVRR